MSDKMKIAIITGATSGLGLEFAKQIDAKGGIDEIWLVARNEQKLESVAHSLSTPSIAVPADLSKPADIATIANKLAEEDLTVQILVNSAGFGRMGAWDQISDEDEESMIDLNCKGLVCMTRACLPHMHHGSRIIQVASAAAFMPMPYMNVYSATKAFVLHYSRALQWEVFKNGITVTALCPAWVKTGFEAEARKSNGSAQVKSTPFEQDPHTVVERALSASSMHLAVCCAGLLSESLRIATKVAPTCLSMACWNIIRKL